MAEPNQQPPHKRDGAAIVDFDEQRWPVNLAIVALAGFVAGVLLTTTHDFNDPRILYNGWVRLGSVVLMVGVLFWGATLLQGRMRRRIQLCVLLSLLFHLCLAVYLHDRYLVALAERGRGQTAHLGEEHPRDVAPDYHWETIEQPAVQQEFEKPVETALPADSVPEPLEPEEVKEPSPWTDREPEEPDVFRPTPEVAELRRAELTAPRREQPGGRQISRQPRPLRLEPEEPIPQPAIAPAREQPSTLEPRVNVQRQQPAPAVARQTLQPEPEMAEPRRVAPLARRAVPAEPSVARASPRAPARRPTSVEVADREVPPPDPLPAVGEPSDPLQSPAPAATRQAALPTAPRREAMIAAEPRPPAPIQGLAGQRRRSDQTPRVEPPSQAEPLARATRQADSHALTPAPIAPPAIPSVGAEAPASPSLEPPASAVAVERSAQATPVGATVAAAGAAELASGPGPVAAQVGQPRSVLGSEPSVAPNGPAPRFARAVDGIPLPTNAQPERIEVPSIPAQAGGRASPELAANAAGTAVGPAGDVGIPDPHSTLAAGEGAEVSPGVSGRLGSARLARVDGPKVMAPAQAGGGVARPTRAAGRSLADEGKAEMPQMANLPSGGQSHGPPLDARLSGHQREVGGLPGAWRGEPATGAVAALRDAPGSVPQAVARRARSSQAREPGGLGPSPATGAALARSPVGVQLPAAAVPFEHTPTTGAGRSAGSGSQVAQAMVAPGDTSLGPQGEALPGNLLDRPAGGAPSDTAMLEPAASLAGSAAGLRRRRSGDNQHPSLAVHLGATPPGRRIAPATLPGQAEPGELEAGAGGESGTVASRVEPGTIDVPAGATEVGQPSRQEGGLPVLIAAAEGPGGLSSDRAPLVGIPSRRARPESEVVHSLNRRFVLQRSGGQWTLEGKVLEPPAQAFRQRDPSHRSRIAKEYGGSEGTERAVELGLDFLARNQFPDGRWCLDRFPGGQDAGEAEFAPGEMNCDTAATGLALLSFLGAGYTHLEDKHRGTVGRGLQWLLQNQQPNGQLFTRETDATQPARSYGHGIASIALCEAYGMTRDPRLRPAAQKAIQFIVEAQDPQRGGWRYTQPDDAPTWYKESDTSVSGWMLMALKSAQMAGLEVPETSLRKVAQWLDVAQAQNGALYVYNPYAALTPAQIQGRSPNRAMTAEGLLMRLYLGWQRDNPALVAGAEYLKANLPALGTAEQPLRDSYYWYYATQVMFQMQGDYWTAWNDRLQALLEPSQVTSGPLAGSWHPRHPLSDRWAHAGGRLYVTTLNLLMLEVYYRHLPLFRSLAEH